MRQEHLEDIYTFNASATGGALHREHQQAVLTQILTGPDKVCDLSKNGERVAVGFIVDACANSFNSAELTLLVRDGNVAAMDAVLDWAMPIIRRGPRTAVDLPQWNKTPFPKEWLSRHGFGPGYSMFHMKLPELRSRPALDLPSGWRWQEYEEQYFDSYFETLCESFKEIPGAFIPEESVFRKRSRSSSPRANLLLEGKKVVGFVRTQVTDAEGELAILARHPARRGKSIGKHLVEKGLLQLKELGAQAVSLDVAATNRTALQLYESFGFRLIQERVVFQKQAR